MAAHKPLKVRINYSEARLNTLQRVLDSAGPVPDVAHAIDVLKAGYWFEALRRRTQQPTPYAVGKLVQPATYMKGIDGRDAYHHNLWAKYAKGECLPGPRTAEAGNRLVAGSADCLSSVAWMAFAVDQPVGGRGDGLLKLLHPAVQKAVYDRVALEAGLYRRRKSLPKMLEMLECQADLDGVAALVVLLRESHDGGDSERCFQVGQSLYRALLMASCSSPFSSMCLELFEFFIRLVFPLASNKEISFDVDRDELSELAVRLTHAVLLLEDLDLIKPINTGSKREWRKILDGQFGFDFKFAFEPRLKLSQDADRTSEPARHLVGARRVAKEWALDALRNGRVERLMPLDVIKAMAAAR